VQKENAIAQQTVIGAAKRNLNQLMGRDADAAFEVGDSIPLDYTPDTALLFKKLYANNTAVVSLQKQTDVARLGVREIRSLLLPRVSLFAGYAGSRSDNTVGALLLNQSYGPQIGGGIAIPLYQSGNVLRQIAAATLQLQSTEYELMGAQRQADLELHNTLDEYENQRRLLEIEKNNVVLAKENLEISMQRLRLGQSTALELHQAQENFEQSRTRLTDIEFNLKAAETKLKQLVASL
jgi:outer membrane protein